MEPSKNSFLISANLIIVICFFYFSYFYFNLPKPYGNETIVQLLYFGGLIGVVLDLFVVFKKDISKKISVQRIVLVLLIFIHLTANSFLFFLFEYLMQL